ncbi:asparaginase [Rhizobium sp. Td3]|nr:asparaginase [Rhizobium sp. RM]TMV21231.1 asparaginase [Rhizobium sp. Td3]
MRFLVKEAQSTPLVTVIATGGTIASKRGEDGAFKPALTGDDLLSVLPEVDARLRTVNLMSKDSSSLTFADMQSISDAVKRQIADGEVRGVVVMHGTDTMEESALLVHLQNAIEKPVIFTGAQFAADHPCSDGPTNLHHAISLASDAVNAARGVQIAFGGRTVSAWGAYKFSSDKADAFRNARGETTKAKLELSGRVDPVRVDMIAIYPGCDATQIKASVEAGAHGIVLQALGSGNANRVIVEAAQECTSKGLPVIISSRVPDGALSPSYGGGGGGHDLAKAGAIHSRKLRPGQARILLAALLASGADADAIRDAFDETVDEMH